MFKELTLTETQGLERALEMADGLIQMDEQVFRTLYERTGRPLWTYLNRVSGNAALAEDLMQEAYYRILRCRLPEMSQEYLKNYLFRIAANLLRDHWRRAKSDLLSRSSQTDSDPEETFPRVDGAQDAAVVQSDLHKMLDKMNPRERELLWLAYVEGMSHREIAGIVGAKEQSVRPLLFRARQKLVALLKKRGYGSGREGR